MIDNLIDKLNKILAISPRVVEEIVKDIRCDELKDRYIPCRCDKAMSFISVVDIINWAFPDEPIEKIYNNGKLIGFKKKYG